MTPYNLFDGNCTLGRHLKVHAEAPHTAADLLADMDHHGIAEALVLDCLSRECHPEEGNRRIVEVTSSAPRLHPAWSALPHGPCDEQPAPEEFLEAMRSNGVGALFLFPRQYRFRLSDWCVDAFLEPLADAGVPVFLNFNEIGPQGLGVDETDWDQVVALCRRWPNLPVIVSEHRIRRTNRLLYRALDSCANLRVECSGLWLHRAVEFITEHWGASRLVFGSNWPHLNQAAALTPLTLAELADEDKRLIGGENLRQLTGWCDARRPRVELPPPADEFVAVAQTGQRPEGMTFQDCHGHLGGRAGHYHLPGCDLDGIVRDMDRLGVERVCVFSFSVVFSDEQVGNDYVAAACARYPDRFVGFTGLNPHRGHSEMLRELERCHKLGLRGIKLITHYQGFPAEHPLIEAACRWAHDHRQIILHHHWGSPEYVEHLVSTYPHACFVTGHATAAYAAVMKKHANLFVCSCPVHTPRAVENLVAAIGAERLLFGSDLQDLPIAWGLGPIFCARIPPREKRLILGENLNRLLRRYSRP